MTSERVRRCARMASVVAVICSLGAAQASAGRWVGNPTSPASLGGAVDRLGFAADDVASLAAGKAAARQLDTEHDAELAAMGVVVLNASVDDVVESFRDLSILRRSGMAACAGRFSAQPTVDDLACLPIPDADLAVLPKAKAGDSDVKLSESEIAAIQTAEGTTMDLVFKNALVGRVNAWQQNGVDGLGSYSDKKRRVTQSEITTGLLTSLRAQRAGEVKHVETFEYWAVEQFGNFKPLVDVNSISIYSGPGFARIETTQLYASHYCDGLVTGFDLIPIQDQAGPATLLRLTFRVRMDSLGGIFGGLKRKIGRGKIVEQVADGLERIRTAFDPQA